VCIIFQQMEAGIGPLLHQWGSIPTLSHSPKSLYDFCCRHYILLHPRLKRCFFYILLYPESQFIFALKDSTQKAGQVSWTVLPQGFRDSTYLFGLAEWKYPQISFLQYVNDLPLFGSAEPGVSWTTESLSNFLADRAYKISREKAQLC
jgi:hypothetical protein